MNDNTKGLSRRDFFKAAATGGMTVAALGALSACGSPDEGADSGTAGTAGTGDAPVVAAGSYDVMSQFSGFKRGENPDAVAATTPEDFIAAGGGGGLSVDFAGNAPLGITPADFMLNVPAWLGEVPQITDIAGTEECDILVIGAGNAGSTAALHAAELGAKVFLAETQTYNEYDEYACDMACYNSKLFMNKGTPAYDLLEVTNEYIRLARGHANWKIIKDYATRSGEMLDWMIDNYIPADITERYAKTSNYKGNPNFSGESAGQKSFIGMAQWRDQETNNNMWPFVIRSLHSALEQLGGQVKWGYQGQTLVQDASGAVTGAIFKDIDGAYQQVNAKAVIVTTGSYGGNHDMRIDLCDSMRNLAWAYGSDRTDPMSIGGMGRDGSGIRMILWAGGTMESGPRAGMSIGKNGVPGFSFGGAWPVFGPEGKRFLNESMIKFSSNGYLDTLPDGKIMVALTDKNWETYLSYQGYGHETMDRSSDFMVAKTRADMDAYVTGPDGFMVQAFARFGNDGSPVYAADTLEEVADIIGYTEEVKQNFVAEVAHYNELCAAGKDTDWGCDPQILFPIKEAPYFFSFGTTGGGISNGLVMLSGVNTDDNYRCVRGDKTVIPGLYAAGNTCGNRYSVQYATPTAGNSCAFALTTGYVAGEVAVNNL
jgi:hypothetical protein